MQDIVQTARAAPPHFSEEAERFFVKQAQTQAEKVYEQMKHLTLSLDLSGSLPLTESQSCDDMVAFLDQFIDRQLKANEETQHAIHDGEKTLLKTARQTKAELVDEIENCVSTAIGSLNERLVSGESLEQAVERLRMEKMVESRRADDACEQLAATKLHLHDAQNQISRLVSEKQAQERESKALLQALQSGEELLQLAAANVAKQHSVICELQDENLQLIDSSMSCCEDSNAQEDAGQEQGRHFAAAEQAVPIDADELQAPPADAFSQAKKPRQV